MCGPSSVEDGGVVGSRSSGSPILVEVDHVDVAGGSRLVWSGPAAESAGESSEVSDSLTHLERLESLAVHESHGRPVVSD